MNPKGPLQMACISLENRSLDASQWALTGHSQRRPLTFKYFTAEETAMVFFKPEQMIPAHLSPCHYCPSPQLAHHPATLQVSCLHSAAVNRQAVSAAETRTTKTALMPSLSPSCPISRAVRLARMHRMSFYSSAKHWNWEVWLRVSDNVPQHLFMSLSPQSNAGQMREGGWRSPFFLIKSAHLEHWIFGVKTCKIACYHQICLNTSI